MLPDGLAVLVIALALVPGWLHLRLRERLRPPSSATGLSELLEVTAVGLLTTGVSAVVLVLAPHHWLPWLLDIEGWARGGDDYLRHNVRASVISAAAVLGLALSIAALLHWVQRRRSADRFDPESSVWGQALGVRPQRTVPWIGLQLRDGQLVEGVLHSLSLGQEDQDERDIALARPIRVTAPGGDARPVELDRIVVPAREVLHIGVIHVPDASRESGTTVRNH